MKIPLRPSVVFVASLLSLCACSLAYSGRPSEADRYASGLDTGIPRAGTSASSPSETVVIPGPLRSFLRMAGVSQKIVPEDVLPLLSRNVFLRGYQNGTR